MGGEGKKAMSDPTGPGGAGLEPLKLFFCVFFNSWSTLEGHDLRLEYYEISGFGLMG